LAKTEKRGRELAPSKFYGPSPSPTGFALVLSWFRSGWSLLKYA